MVGPVAKKTLAGLRLTRENPALIMDGGFRIESAESYHIAGLLKAWTHCWWGSAVPAGQVVHSVNS